MAILSCPRCGRTDAKAGAVWGCPCCRERYEAGSRWWDSGWSAVESPDERANALAIGKERSR